MWIIVFKVEVYLTSDCYDTLTPHKVTMCRGCALFSCLKSKSIWPHIATAPYLNSTGCKKVSNTRTPPCVPQKPRRSHHEVIPASPPEKRDEIQTDAAVDDIQTQSTKDDELCPTLAAEDQFDSEGVPLAGSEYLGFGRMSSAFAVCMMWLVEYILWANQLCESYLYIHIAVKERTLT